MGRALGGKNGIRGEGGKGHGERRGGGKGRGKEKTRGTKKRHDRRRWIDELVEKRNSWDNPTKPSAIPHKYKKIVKE